MTQVAVEERVRASVDDYVRRPSFKVGAAIFFTRVLSLVAALVVAVVISVVTFFVLFFPAVAGYYLAVAQSRPEVQFIDLANVFRTTGLVFRGAVRHFAGSIVLGLMTLVPAAALLLSPVIVWEAFGDDALPVALLMELLFFPAFYVAGCTLLFGFPALITGRGVWLSVRVSYAIRRERILVCTLTGFIVLFPIPGLLFHLLMVFSYPLLVAWAVSDIANDPGPLARQSSS